MRSGSGKQKRRNPFEPMESVVSGLLLLIVLAVLVGVPMALTGSASFFGWGDGPVCGTAANVSASVDYHGVKPGSFANADGVRVCTEHADTGQHLLGMLTELPDFLVFAGAMVLLWRLIRAAKAEGPRTTGIADRLRWFGWFLLVAGLVAMVVQGMAERFLLATLLDGDLGSPLGVVYWDWPVVALLAALGALTFARILRYGTEEEPA